MVSISGAEIILEDKILRNTNIVFDGKKIQGIDTGVADSVSFPNAYILPGFIDLHTHGRLGKTMFDIDHDLLKKYAQTGTTSLLVGEGGFEFEELQSWMACVDALMADPQPGEAEILGMHLEGPYIDPQNCGAMKTHVHIEPEEETLQFIESNENVKYITISPYINGALDAIKRLTKAGKICVTGHSRGSGELMERAHAAGIKGVCHFLNNNTANDVFKEPGVRNPTLCEAALLYDDMHLEIICDMQHVDPVYIKLAMRVKGPKKIAVITDSILVAGLPDDIYQRKDGRSIALKDGGVHLCESGGRSGSCVNQVEEFGNLVDKLGVSAVDAARMCSLTPAEILGVDDKIGSLASGKNADILVVDRDTLELQAVFVKGRQIK